MQNMANRLKGVYRDILKEPGRGVIFDSGWQSNTIVDSSRILLAGLMRGCSVGGTPNDGIKYGIKYLAVGQGNESWDENIPEINPADTDALEAPAEDHIPAEELSFSYLTDDDQLRTDLNNPTNRLQIKATLPAGYPDTSKPYPLREFGLFGSIGYTDNSDNSESDDYLINLIRHPVIHKGQSATLIRVVRLYF
jgi:hypothetical protein